MKSHTYKNLGEFGLKTSLYGPKRLCLYFLEFAISKGHLYIGIGWPPSKSIRNAIAFVF